MTNNFGLHIYIVSFTSRYNICYTYKYINLNYWVVVSEMLCRQVAWKGILRILTRVFGNAVKRSFCSCGNGRMSTCGLAMFNLSSSVKHKNKILYDLNVNVKNCICIKNSCQWHYKWNVKKKSFIIIVWTFQRTFRAVVDFFFVDIFDQS